MTPRTTPSLASMRWMVGSDTPERRASSRWSMPSSARGAHLRTGDQADRRGMKVIHIHPVRTPPCNIDV
jgi:hypothetical protein